MEEARRPQRPAEPSRGSPRRSSRGAGRREGWAEPSSPGPPQTRVAPQSPGRGAPGPSAPSRSALPRGEGGARRGNRPRSRGRWKRGRVPAGGRPARSHWRRFLPRGTPTRCGFLEVPRALAPQSPDSRPRLPAPPSPAPRPAPSVGPGARAPPRSSLAGCRDRAERAEAGLEFLSYLRPRILTKEKNYGTPTLFCFLPCSRGII